MACFIELTTEPFEEERGRQADIQRKGDDSTSLSGRRFARRPLRGLEIKEDRVAAVKVVRADGVEIPLVDAGDPYGNGTTSSGYTNFILQNVSEARMEKHQIVETFGESYIFFFGESPRFLDVQMVVINSHDFNWEAEWWENYDRYFRGTKLVEMGARLYMFYDDNVVEGYMLNCQGVKVSDQPLMVQMSFRLYLTGHRNITFIGDPQYPIRANAILPESAFLDPTVRGSLSSYLRTAPQTVAYPPGIAQRIEELGSPALEEARDQGVPIRGLIAENRDEYLGLSESLTQVGLDVLSGAISRAQQEVEDLQQAVIQSVRELGGDVNNPQAMKNLGLMPLFGDGTTNSSGQATVGVASATFTPKSGASYGTSLTTVPVSSSPGVNQRQKDPLGAVFGGGTRTQIVDRTTVQGGGDREYGYGSDYATRPGFGKPGYGDYGGNGFGSGQGAGGDPGFRDPNLFSFSGVAGNTAAFARFNKPKKNNTVFGAGGTSQGDPRIGLGSSNSGLSGGCATRVPGRPSSFSIISTDGSLLFAESFSL